MGGCTKICYGRRKREHVKGASNLADDLVTWQKQQTRGEKMVIEVVMIAFVSASITIIKRDGEAEEGGMGCEVIFPYAIHIRTRMFFFSF